VKQIDQNARNLVDEIFTFKNLKTITNIIT